MKSAMIQRLTVLGLLAIGAAANATDFASELPRIPPTEPADAIATFTVAPGFRLELVASEPLIESPVACEWDENGRLYVCEMRGYSEQRDDGLSRISLLEDTDGDGRYDRSTVFADGLLWPTAIFPYDGGLFVADAPDVFFLRDTDGDGRADEKTLVLTGFGTSNVQGLVNCFRWGIDNRLHLATSSCGGEIRRAADPADTPPVSIRGRDLAIDPRTGAFTLTSGASQHGMSFDDWGRKFVSHNSNHIQQVMYEDRYVARNPFLAAPSPRAMIAADGPQAEVYRTSPVEPWRVLRTRLRVSGAARGGVEGGGRAAGYFTGATGVTIYRGDAWPAEWHGIAVVGDAGGNLVHRKRLEGPGVELVARRIDQESEFVSSRDIWSRPVQFANAPDGTLHIIDTYREVIEHPHSIPPEIKQHLDLTSGRDRGRIYRIAPEDFRSRPIPRLGAASTRELVGLLEHPNAWHRETASRLLFIRQDPAAVPLLRAVAVESPSPLARMHALYALSGQQASGSPDPTGSLGGLDPQVVLAGLRDPAPGVRRHAVRLAESFFAEPGIVEAAAALADDPDIEVRCQVAFSLGERAEMPAAVVPVARAALVKIGCRDAGDRWMRVAIQSSAVDDAGELLAGLFAAAATGDLPPESAPLIEALAAQVAMQDREVEVRRLVGLLGPGRDVEPGIAIALARGLAVGLGRPGSTLARLRDAGGLEQLDDIVAGLVEGAMQTAGDSEASISSRVAAIEGLGMGLFPAVRATLEPLLDPREPVAIQAAAVARIGGFPDAEALDVLIDAWPALAPRLKEAALEPLSTRPDRAIALFAAIEAGRIPAADIPVARLRLLETSKHPQVAAGATRLLARAGSAHRQDVLTAYAGCLSLEGDVDRGRLVFRAACAACHRVEGAGHELGPNLSSMKSRGPEAILVNVLDPNREVNPLYMNYVCITEDGRTVTGMLAAETATSVTLRRAEGAEDTVLRSDIEELRSLGQSMMPEGLEKQVDPQAMADLIAYLMWAP
jgi:putative membrane-bound dehydrogenase-like protein